MDNNRDAEAPTSYNPNEDAAFQTRVAEDWLNKQRTLVVLSRNARNNERQLAKELTQLMCHSKTDSVLDKGDIFLQLSELCRLRSCNNCLYFEQKKGEVYLWLARHKEGPSLKFRLSEIVLSENNKFHGNCLKASRPILSFEADFLKTPELAIAKNLLVDCFNIPKNHPKSQPFFDKVYAFGVSEGRIYFRNYELAKKGPKSSEIDMTEIGPRFTLEPVKVLEGFFGGHVLWHNPSFQKLSDFKEIRIQRVEAKIEGKRIKKQRREKKMKHQLEKRPQTVHEALLGE
jgi:ribosome biogenesis protein BRX1